MGNIQRKLTAIDLFAGCGGLTQGLKDAGYSVRGAVEIDFKARETYLLNHPGIPLIGTDIRQVELDDVLAITGLMPGELDLLAGCPPCQGFSTMRRKNKAVEVFDPRNDLIDEFTRLAIALKPKIIMMENVPGIVEYPRFKAMVDELNMCGYSVIYQILDIATFGVPQRRRRLILSANRTGTAVLAKPTGRMSTVRKAIGKLPVPGATGDAIHDFPARRSARVELVIKNIPKDGGSRTSLPDSLQLACHRKNGGFFDVYGRMKWDDVSPTITSGCTNPSKGRFLHPEQDRTITLREAAILQGFPRKYKFIGSHGKESISLMIGNALPPSFISAHAALMAESIYNEEY
ncbi:DNA (cytosine-5)-methyltransferase 1 [Janthinobacterium sp. 78]|nr:DNA (cytosine-5)-methyltransferase 1 [Janthinobacterium sp. 78]